MKVSPDVAAALSTLSEVLDDPDLDLAHTLDQLADLVRAAVPSSVALSVSSGTDGARMQLTGGRDDPKIADIAASLMITLPSAGRPVTRTTIVLYATAKGAFVDLAADVGWLASTRVTDIVLDAHLTLPAHSDPQATLRAMSTMNQAIGMLLGRGYLPEHAESHIHQRATRTDISAHAAAELIIGELLEAGPGPEPGGDAF